jgi:hypothetical protein
VYEAGIGLMLRAAFTVAGAVSGLHRLYLLLANTHRLPIDSDPGALVIENNCPSDTSGAQGTRLLRASQAPITQLDFIYSGT